MSGGWRDGQWVGPPFPGCFPPVVAQQLPSYRRAQQQGPLPAALPPGFVFATAQAHAAMPATVDPPITSEDAEFGSDGAEDSATAAAAEPAAAQGQPAAPAAAEQSTCPPPARAPAAARAGAPAAGGSAKSHVHLTDDRLLVIVRQADAEDYAQKILAGKKGEVMTTIHAKLSLDRTNFPTVPAKATVQSWLESALAKRKAAVGANADKEHTGDGSEDEVCTLPLVHACV